MRVAFLVLATGLVLTGPAPALARGDPRLEVELALGISGSTELRTVIMTSPLLTLSAPMTDVTGFVAQWGFTVASGEPTSDIWDATWFAVGNPLLGWSISFVEGLVFTPSLTLPLASSPEGEAGRPAADFAYRGGLGLRGSVDPWLWKPDQIAVVLPVSYVRWFDPLLFESHTKLGFMAPTAADDVDDDFVLQQQLRLAAHFGAGVWLALAASAVYIPTDSDDNFQSSVAPELRYVIGPGSHFELAVLMNIDGPYGPFSERGRFWAIHVGGSFRL